MSPTVLLDLQPTDPVIREEVFGPVLAVLSVDSFDEAVAVANDTPYGLASSVYTSDLDTALRFTEHVRSGIVKVNLLTSANESHVPFGGLKDSGPGENELGKGSQAVLHRVQDHLRRGRDELEPRWTVGELIHEHVIAPKQGYALQVDRGQHLRIIDLEGKQCCDLVVFNRDNLRDRLSTSYSRTRQTPRAGDAWRAVARLTEGDVLLSTVCTPLMTIAKETAEPKGIHDTYIRMCNRSLYEQYGLAPQDGCLEIISGVLGPFGIRPEDVPDPFNIWLNLEYDCDTDGWTSREGVTRPGDYIELRAEIDCLVAISNCPEDQLTPCNAYKVTPIKVEVRDGDV